MRTPSFISPLLRLSFFGLMGLLPLAGLRAQSVGVGTTAPDASAALDVVSSSKGALLPRVASVAGIASPAPGLIVYQTGGSQPGFWYNTGTAAVPKWLRLTDSDGVKYDSVSGLQVGPGTVQGSTPTVGDPNGTPFTTFLFSGNAPDGRVVYLYRAADLAAAGLVAGPIRQLELMVRTKGSTQPYSGFRLALGLTNATSVSSYPAGLTTVYSGNYTTQTGWNAFVLPTPFSWDGSSNLYLQACYDNATATDADNTTMLTVSYNGAYGTTDFSNTTPGCALTTSSGSITTTRIPVLRLTQGTPGAYTLPATGGQPGQILVQQPNGTLGWGDQPWLEKSGNVYRGPGNVGIGASFPQTRLAISPLVTEPKITLWDGNSATSHYGFGVSGFQLNYHVGSTADNHVFYAGGKNGAEPGVSTELLRLQGNGFLTVGGAGNNNARLEIVNDGSGSGGADDVVLRSYGSATGPGISLQSFRGSRAAPTALATGDFIGEVGFAGNTSNGLGYFTTTGLVGYYRGDGTNFLSDLYLKTSGLARLRIDETGRVGIGNFSPQHPLHVQGAIAANTDKGIVLDAQDRPIITRGFDLFTSGNYTGLGRWGLFMEPNNLTMGVPVLGGRHFQWATYNLDSSIGSVLMHLDQNGFLGLGTGAATPASRLDVVNDGSGSSGADDVVVRSYGTAVFPAFGIRRYRGTLAAPANLQVGDFLGEYALGGYVNGAQSALDLSGLQAYYQGNGTTALTDLRLLTSGSPRLLIDATGRVGVSNLTPAYPLDVTGIANSSKLYVGAAPALFFGSVGVSNLWVGTRSEAGIAANGLGNTSVGVSAGNALSSGSSNTLLGNTAGTVLANGGFNTFLGSGAGGSSVSDSFNTLVGYSAGGNLNGGASNTMLGYLAGNNLSTGASNTALGYRAGTSLGAGMRNTLVGHSTGDDVSNFDNTAVGDQAAANVTTGGKNTFLGSGADLASTTQRSNATAIGYQAKVNADNALVLGGTGANAVKVGIGTTSPSQRLEVVEPNAGSIALYAHSTYVGNSSGRGVYGVSENNPGVGYGGYFIGGNVGAYGYSDGDIYSGATYGLYGNVSGTAGTRYAVRADASVGIGTATAYGIYANASGASTNYAGYFQGNVHVQGTLSKSAGSFRIDHPQDPDNKYLVHSFVESPDMLNVYNGNVTTDAQGRAVVPLPGYFEAENIDFKYQLTVIGQFAQAIVGEKVKNNQFVVRTDKPHVEVSWQVTGVRNDAYAQQHRLVPEEAKRPEERGKYLNPEELGKPASRALYAPEEAPASEAARASK